MFPYIGLYVFPALLALQRSALRGPLMWVIGLLFTLIIGLRFEVGADWGNYLVHLYRVGELSLFEVLRDSDPGYYFINWLTINIGAGIWLVNLVCAGLFVAGLGRFCQRMPEPFLALAVATPYMAMVLAMGYTRQAAAFGLLLWALPYLFDRRSLNFLLTITLAATFHKSAILVLPLAVLAGTERRLTTVLWAGISTLVLYLLFLAEQVDSLWANYVESDYAMAAEGGAIRVLLNVTPAVVLLVFYRYFKMPAHIKPLWFWMAVFSLVALPLVFQAATAVDRVALYLMPIQLVVWSHLPGLFHPRQRALIRLGIIAVYAAVLLVWLNFANHASSWVPYQFYPLAV